MSLVAMKQEELDTLSDERLGWVCMEPTFQLIRGKSPSVKSTVISTLTEGQRALCMFRVMYDHSCNSAGEFYAWLAYMQEFPGYWSGVTEGLQFFGDHGMILLLQDTKAVLERRNEELGQQWGDVAITDLEREPHLLAMMTSLFVRFQDIAPESLKLIGDYIRTHLEEFVELESPKE